MLSIFNIQRYSLQDGEGIRTNIFFKGCTLRCQWCNNPEGLDPEPSVMFDERLCKKFGDCIKAAGGRIKTMNDTLVIEREKIMDAVKLRDICPVKALTVVGEKMTIQRIITEIEKDRPFYLMSSGGVTITGGEPFFQGPELKDLLRELKKMNINISAETSLHVPWKAVGNLAEYVDVFLPDLKHIDPEKFMKYTGGDARLVLDNFRRLNDTRKKFFVRVPVIPEFNYSESELHAIIDFASELRNARGIHFIPYHSLGKEKYLMLGKEYNFDYHGKIEKSSLKQYVDYAFKKGLEATILN
jgi:pyruvate formate lyase activating enzyme